MALKVLRTISLYGFALITIIVVGGDSMDALMRLLEQNLDFIFVLIVISAFMIFLYFKFCRKPKIKVVNVPTHKEILRQHKKGRFRRRIKRIFHIPYRGNARMYEFDKTAPYIDAAWEELRKH